ncbi:hypothetical protein ACFL3G_13180 [Planctomycetota bacterium]
MRNVFDQYDQPENKLTHALMVTLANDKKLVRPFLKLVGVKRVPALKNIELGLQRVPGQEVDSNKDGKDGLPDGCFFDQDGWAVVIEAKVQAGICVNQLKRHRKTSARYGYEQPYVVLLSIDKPKSLPDWATHLEWKNLYSWFSRRAADSSWARQFVEYMHVFEARMIAKDYNIRGTLTMFDGFKFRDTEPYTYAEGKRLIRLLGDDLRKRKKLIKDLGIDAKAPGRAAITRGDYGAVWDFLPLTIGRGKLPTATVHLTLVIRPQEVGIALTVPNAMRGIKKILRNSDAESLGQMLSQVEKNLRPVIKKMEKAKPKIYIEQRYYKSQRSHPRTDGRIEVDLRTVLNIAKGQLKHQPGWLESIFKLLVNKKTNMQWGVQLHCPHSEKVMQSAKAIDIMVDTWIAMTPLRDFVAS